MDFVLADVLALGIWPRQESSFVVCAWRYGFDFRVATV